MRREKKLFTAGFELKYAEIFCHSCFFCSFTAAFVVLSKIPLRPNRSTNSHKRSVSACDHFTCFFLFGFSSMSLFSPAIAFAEIEPNDIFVASKMARTEIEINVLFYVCCLLRRGQFLRWKLAIFDIFIRHFMSKITICPLSTISWRNDASGSNTSFQFHYRGEEQHFCGAIFGTSSRCALTPSATATASSHRGEKCHRPTTGR